jgi:hypothetical protein
LPTTNARAKREKGEVVTTIPKLPPQFSELEAFSDWILSSEKDRFAKRLASTMPELQAFYDATMARADEAVALLEQYSLDDIPDDVKHLLWLYCSLVTASFAIECWRQPFVPDSGASSIDAVLEPAI